MCAERIGAAGEVVVPLDEAAVERAVAELVADDVAAIAVSYLFSFVNPDHELRTRDIIQRLYPGLMVSLSCEVDPAFREYERTCVTAFDAYVKPVVGRYLEDMERDLAARRGRGAVADHAVARRHRRRRRWRGGGRCGCFCRDRPPVWSAGWRSDARSGSTI